MERGHLDSSPSFQSLPGLGLVTGCLWLFTATAAAKLSPSEGLGLECEVLATASKRQGTDRRDVCGGLHAANSDS